MTRLTSDIREVSSIVFCSSCFNQAPELRHVDFDAACDRGYGKTESVQVAMDDLILCENCVKEGAELIGMTDDAAQREHVADLERRLLVEEKLREKAERFSETMEDALSQKDVRIDHRKRPRATKELEAA